MRQSTDGNLDSSSTDRDDKIISSASRLTNKKNVKDVLEGLKSSQIGAASAASLPTANGQRTLVARAQCGGRSSGVVAEQWRP